MKIELVQLFPPIINIYTECCVPERFSGYNVGPINFIKPSAIRDKGLIEHEITHAKQVWRNPFKYTFGRWLKYFKFLPKKWRDWSNKMTVEFEAEGYAVQICTYLKENLILKTDVEQLQERFAEYILTKYNIYDVDFDYIKRRIQFYMEEICLN